MAWYGGIDVGSVTTKIVLMKDGELSFFRKLPSGSNFKKAADTVFSEILETAGLAAHDVKSITATGAGALRAEFAHRRIGDLTSCAVGVHHLLNDVKTIIEVGGQASKVLRINDHGKIINFAVSEKCAAGSGRFLQVIAKVLQIDLNEVGPLSLKSDNPVSFTTSCAVFGESEAVSRVAEGTSKEDILAGVHEALSRKISTLMARIDPAPPCAIVGGGALDIGLLKRAEGILKLDLVRPANPQIVTALGAALHAQSSEEL